MNKQDEAFFSKDLTDLLILSVGGYISPERLELFFKKLQKELTKYAFTQNTETNLIRLITSVFDKVSFINDAIKYPHHLEIISAIVSYSNFLTDIVVQNPGFLYQVFDNEYLSRIETSNSFAREIKNEIIRYKTFNSKLNFLKQFKKRYILKIGLTDILGFSGIISITSQLSELAGSLLSMLFEICRNETEAKYSTQIPEGSYCLASLGKQGGNELNYSSDVDLILFYEKDYIPEGSAKKEYFELLNETVLLFIKSSSELTEKGYLYRIDFRLRPDGRNSLLCRTITDYMRYYETRGENWERQMLIKLNFICGGKELYNSFFKYVSGFIFQSTYRHSIKEQVKKIKANIEKKAAGTDNIKLFLGGIRDIEFSVQVLQLLNGGRIKEIRNGNTLESIILLRKYGLLSHKEADLFEKAYIFYRKTEHFLQLMNDRQTHLIPDDNELLVKLAIYCNLKGGQEFQKKLSEYRIKVRKIYARILKIDSLKKVDSFAKINFINKSRADKNLAFLQNGAGLLGEKKFETNTIESFQLIEEIILKYLRLTPVPDKTLENFTKVIKTSQFPSMWYKQFQSKKFLKAFLKICEFSQISIDLLTSGRQMEDYFLSGNCFLKPDKETLTEIDFNQLLLNLSILYTLKTINEKIFSALLSKAIDTRIIKFSQNNSAPFFIAALGSYGSNEMNFASDIDFIIVIDDDSDLYQADKEYKDLIKHLNTEIDHFNIDLRLRPEGKNSQLVRTLSSYKTYLDERARIWELQSLSKLRFVFGSKKLFNSFVRIVVNRVEKLDKDFLKREFLEMHNSITKSSSILESEYIELKKAKGGFATIEFAVQFLFLLDASIFEKCIGRSIVTNLRYLEKHSKFQSEMNILARNYSYLKKRLLFNQNFTGFTNYKIEKSPDASEKQLKETMKQNFTLFNNLLEN